MEGWRFADNGHSRAPKNIPITELVIGKKTLLTLEYTAYIAFFGLTTS